MDEHSTKEEKHEVQINGMGTLLTYFFPYKK